jgi:hypothetical protein
VWTGAVLTLRWRRREASCSTTVTSASESWFRMSARIPVCFVSGKGVSGSGRRT